MIQYAVKHSLFMLTHTFSSRTSAELPTLEETYSSLSKPLSKTPMFMTSFFCPLLATRLTCLTLRQTLPKHCLSKIDPTFRPYVSRLIARLWSLSTKKAFPWSSICQGKSWWPTLTLGTRWQQWRFPQIQGFSSLHARSKLRFLRHQAILKLFHHLSCIRSTGTCTHKGLEA